MQLPQDLAEARGKQGVGDVGRNEVRPTHGAMDNQRVRFMN